MTRQGVEVDYCQECHGVWFDRGEILAFVPEARQMQAELERAMEQAVMGTVPSPRRQEPMQRITLEGGIALDWCKGSGGLWFDHGALKITAKESAAIHIQLDEMFHGGERVDDGVKVSPLPSLMISSLVPALFLLVLFSLPAFIAATFISLDGASLVYFLAAGGFISFLLGPWLMDLTLYLFYTTDRAKDEDLPDHLRLFVEKVSVAHQITSPRFYLIDDSAPQAYTYGHRPGNARIVISRGLIEQLNAEELEAVIAHEIGHALHWDLLLMTLVQLVPLFFYKIYQSIVEGILSRMDGSKISLPIAFIALCLYLLGFLSELMVLKLSRTREYHADRFSAKATGNPEALASALVTIGYGLAKHESSLKEGRAATITKKPVNPLGAMGIFAVEAAHGAALLGQINSGAHRDEKRRHTWGGERLHGVMRWELWNPWASYYELFSTHPLIIKRIKSLSDFAPSLGRERFLKFNLKKPQSYWDAFGIDLFMRYLPVASTLLIVTFVAWLRGDVALQKWALSLSAQSQWLLIGVGLMVYGITGYMRHAWSYRRSYFPQMSIATLLKRVKVSPVRGVPCCVKARVLGRGDPGYIFSNDLVVKDETALIFVQVNHFWTVLDALEGFLTTQKHLGKEVEIVGWYRRSTTPYIEVDYLSIDGEKKRATGPVLQKIAYLLLALAGCLATLYAAFAHG
uniref:Putative Ste24 endopeptidase n=1 Tax=Magnetococcus massalia (strain MO-1) TaxID=451514 RepID=A0A1S7LEP3_MAGMO|nr:putative Ste24 endopeptidase [Candidatus Magnetococcus massalia]